MFNFLIYRLGGVLGDICH